MTTYNNSVNCANPNVAAHDVLISEGSAGQVGVSMPLGTVLYGQGSSNDPIATVISSLLWNSQTTATVTAVVNNAYVITDASAVTVTLPVTAALGSCVAIAGKGAGGWVLAPGSGQTIQFGNVTASTSINSSNLYDCIEVVCIVANTTWAVRSVIGNPSYS